VISTTAHEAPEVLLQMMDKGGNALILWKLGACELADAIARRECSAREAVESALARIRQTEPGIHAFVELEATAERALALADASDARLASGGAPRMLEGVPVAVKDNICIAGVPCTCSSHMLEGWVPPYTATAVERLLEAGAIPLGKTNMDEFAMGSSTEHSAMGPTRNPADPARVPGGSSGGSAAAVASGAPPVALGSDTGGSVRQPASFCGVVGVKPTYGRVSRRGLVAFASSLDQIGVLARDVRDAAAVLEAISGLDPLDSTSSSQDVPPLRRAVEEADPARDLAGLRVGVPREYFGQGLAPDVERAVRAALDAAERAGARITDVNLPAAGHAVATYYVIATAEASSNLARYDGAHYGHRTARAANIIELFSRSRAEGFGREVKRRVMLGTFVLSAGYHDAYYVRAMKVRTLLRRDFDSAFEEVDVLAGPTSPTTAFRLGEFASDPLAMYLADTYTVPANLAALPAVSIPCGIGDGGLPVGLQLVGRAFSEEALLRAARAFELVIGPLADRGAPWRKGA
jgi:aspartyl-tRNA(Asn)/glutamyl-tRNA(Gln) amidotransferase subunit A